MTRWLIPLAWLAGIAFGAAFWIAAITLGQWALSMAVNVVGAK